MTMNLDAEKFEELVELYPQTQENLKLRALEKRSIFMYYKNKIIKRGLAKRKRYEAMGGEEKLAEIKGKIDEQIIPEEDGKDPELYQSTYGYNEKGEKVTDGDSDKDPYHITMPFRKNKELRHKIFNHPAFESDEEHEKEFEELDKENAEKLDSQN